MTELAMSLDVDGTTPLAQTEATSPAPDLLHIRIIEGMALDEPILLQPGERLALEGLSHGSREHLAAFLSGDQLPLAGRISYLGRDLAEHPPLWSKTQPPEILVIPPDGALLANFNAWENIWLVASYHRPEALQDLMQEASDMMQALGLEAHWPVLRPATLESWQRQAVACVRALMLRPRLLVLNAIFEGASSRELTFALALLGIYASSSPETAILYLGEKLPPAIQMKRLVLDF